MRTSVVIPTYRRPEALGRCVRALGRQEAAPDEIIVVARREDEASRRYVREHTGEPIRLVTIDVPAGRPGFVAALNAGIEASRGDVVCLTDDDAEPHPDWIARILATFGRDPAIGAVGGRDWIYHGGQLEEGQESVVGTVSRWGRVLGRHHLGVGPAREVAILKGVNLSVRGELIRQIGFDRRLRGAATEHHSELGLCFRLLQMGYRIVYNPAISVDHRPQPRAGEAREFGPDRVRDAAHNETLALLEYLSLAGKAAHLVWAIAIGTRGAPGLAQAARLLMSTGDPKPRLLFGNLAGRALAVLTYLRSLADSILARRRRREPTSSSGGAPRVMAVVHSPSAGARAEQLLEEIPDSHVAKPSSGARGMASSAWLALRSRAKVLYLVDVGKTTAPAATLGRLAGKRVILDTGDACYALARSLGDRGFGGLLVVGAAEQLAVRSAHELVVRGRAHAAYLPGRVTHIPDLPPAGAGPTRAGALRRSLGLDGAFVVGVVGSLILSRRRGISYGWDLIDLLRHTGPEVVALIAGDGTGLQTLRQRAHELGVSDRCHFVGSVSGDRICEYVCAMDVALSTQTNDLVGQVRTTGKLPLYLACGRPVLASHVGEAARILGPLGWTVPYHGVVDRDYPERLAVAIEAWRADPQGADARSALAVQVSEREFDPSVMRERLRRLIRSEPNHAPALVSAGF